MVKKKTNPLNKRFLRELKSEAGKYIVLFVFYSRCDRACIWIFGCERQYVTGL